MARLNKYYRMHSKQVLEDKIAREINAKNKSDIKCLIFGIPVFIICWLGFSFILSHFLGV